MRARTTCSTSATSVVRSRAAPRTRARHSGSARTRHPRRPRESGDEGASPTRPAGSPSPLRSCPEPPRVPLGVAGTSPAPSRRRSGRPRRAACRRRPAGSATHAAASAPTVSAARRWAPRARSDWPRFGTFFGRNTTDKIRGPYTKTPPAGARRNPSTSIGQSLDIKGRTTNTLRAPRARTPVMLHPTIPLRPPRRAC
jgi:hypothetical protein